MLGKGRNRMYAEQAREIPGTGEGRTGRSVHVLEKNFLEEKGGKKGARDPLATEKERKFVRLSDTSPGGPLFAKFWSKQ